MGGGGRSSWHVEDLDEFKDSRVFAGFETGNMLME